MVLFCLVFVIASQVKVGVAWLFRVAVGPRDPDLLYAIAPYNDLLQRLAYFTLTLVLLAAAVNAVVMGQRARATTAAQEIQPAEATTARGMGS